MLWLTTALLVPVPPWKAAALLAREEAEARRLAMDPRLVPFWSIDLGGTVQQQALGPGWGPVQGDAGRRYRRTLLSSVELRFSSPSWPAALLTVIGAPLDGQTPRVSVILDGQPRGAFDMAGADFVTSLPIGPLDAGRHRLTFEVTPLGTPFTAVAVGTGPLSPPARNSGFVQWLPVGMDERPAFFPSASSPAPPAGSEVVTRGGLRGWYGFGIGPRVGPASTLLEAAHGLAGAALIAILTGLGYAALLATSWTVRLAVAPLLSFASLVFVLVTLRVVGVDPAPGPVALGLVLVGGLPFLRAREEPALVAWHTLAPALLALVALTIFATRVVPPLDDQDLEVQATAHALAHHGAPRTVTDRGTYDFFAHPPLLHVWVAGSFALSGRLDRVGDADRLGQEAASRGPFAEPRADEYPPPYYDLWQRLLERFFTEPELWSTRRVNVVIAAVAVGWLAALAAALAGSAVAGAAVALVLATFPEFLVRGAYGGYFAVATLATVALVATLDRARPGWAAAAAAAFASLSEQKGLLLPAAWLIAAPLGAGFGRFGPGLGAAAGLVAFATWGLAVDAPAFVYDFVKVHVVRRLALGDVRFAHDARIWYPSITELWAEFAARYGLVFTLSAAAASSWALRSAAPRARVCGAAVLLGAIVFSLTDWRQTKHLSLLAAPALLALAAAFPRTRRARLVYLVLIAVMIASNVATAWPLLRDFSSLAPSTIW